MTHSPTVNRDWPYAYLYSRRADLCTCRLGASEQQICFRGEKVQNLTGD